MNCRLRNFVRPSGFVYQLGNLLAAVNLHLQVAIAEAHGNALRAGRWKIVVGTVAL